MVYSGVQSVLKRLEVYRHKTKNGKKKNTPEKRICYFCKTTEDEFHFVMTCKSYVVERKRMLERIEKNSSVFMGLMFCQNEG